MEGLQQLYYLHGIGYDFVKYDGEHVVFDALTRQTAIECCGIEPNDQHAVDRLNFELDIAPWTRVVEPVTLSDSDSGSFVIKVSESLKHSIASIKVPSANIDISVKLSECEEVGDYIHAGNRYVALEVNLGKLPIGYLELLIEGAFGQVVAELWSVPKQCYNPYVSHSSKKPLGVSLQLYTLKSDRNYGIGDFADLKQLIALFSQHGGDFVLLNPLHLLFSAKPEEASPYSPSHRCLINPLYIALDDIQEIVGQACAELFSSVADLGHRRSVTSKFIDYTQTSNVKYALFQILYNCWQQDARQEATLNAFIEEKRSILGDVDLSQFEWFLQWLASEQLQRCQSLCIAKGMEIGLVNDLAVGCTGSGLEFESYRACFSEQANIGAPPDPWAEQGQNWGMPALNPIKVKHNNFAYFKSLVRSNLNQVGALRIDHVMSLRRLWWCFAKEGQELGCYVYYPFEYLLAILKIESHLHSSIVIGEDLGVVPPEVTQALEESAIFGNTLFYFEKNQNGEFKASEQLRKNALIMVANHDVPPFHGWWNAADIDIKFDYQLIDEHQRHHQKHARGVEKARLISWINQHEFPDLEITASSQEVYQAVMHILASSPSQLLAIQLDDLDLQEFPVNIPGTNTEYPNWRRKLNHELVELFELHKDFIQQLNAIRKQQ
ncbi:4-alpha-glucanotransferase [Pseudoalteromonas luteoviolacea]|uniref:4-alpha-glucanotransferase n=1 Tax=Pseudoalteromonas luteoviolacea H33 TaxID=1365251 RepID=A0A167B861_9GAMM|nr:4-alpha-glucanotransferase [Pseudoalteromonas luteoviolacea]KZN46247.1 hypothetical protein N476_03730 [Pseudoalteromonas luteoviolacea H33]KZN75098.1 hypothetical protein N477_19665 [Pseudoalteromonas luteoviolacea H33-S]MBQ4875885.1 4-alpha-glucanotransferase [Pseudoalteromonas luteoviolacea]MBQ4904920.1 4-alpha-glucanotransferase [Pseudoalteromonas luteoviolacea]